MDKTVLIKYELTDILTAVLDKDNVAPAMTKLVETARSLFASVKAETVKAEATKVDDPFTASAKANGEAKAVAEREVRTMTSDLLERYENEPHVIYHLLEAMKVLTDAVRADVAYNVRLATKDSKVPNVQADERAILARDYRELRAMGRTFAEVFALNFGSGGIEYPAGIMMSEDGNVVPNLETLKGNFGSLDDSVSVGRYAKVYQTRFTVESTSEETGTRITTDPHEAVRMIWAPVDRATHSLKDLNEALDKVLDGFNKGETVTLPIITSDGSLVHATKVARD